MNEFNSKGQKKQELSLKEVKKSLTDNILDLSARQISSIPVKALIQLPQATTIDLSNNQITVIPPEFCNLTHITKLDLGNNHIVELPEAFGNLVKLERLDLFSNQLKVLPPSFNKLKNLKWLDLKDNPLEEELHKITGDCLNSKECHMAANKVVRYLQEKIARKDRQQQIQSDNKNMKETNQGKEQNEQKETKKKRKKKKKVLEEPQEKEVVQPEKEENRKEDAPSVGKKKNRQKGRNSSNTNAKSNSRRAGSFSLSGLFRKLLFVLFISSLVGVGLTSYVLFDNCKETSTPWIPKSKLFCEDLNEAFQNYKISSTLHRNLYTTLVSLGDVGLDRMANLLDDLKRNGYAETVRELLLSVFEKSMDFLAATSQLLTQMYRSSRDWYEKNLSAHVDDWLSNLMICSKAVLLMLSDLSSFALAKARLCFAWMTDTVNYYASNTDEILKSLRR